MDGTRVGAASILSFWLDLVKLLQSVKYFSPDPTQCFPSATVFPMERFLVLDIGDNLR
jgi:hypothetical protein